MVGRISTFLPDGPGSIPGGVRNFNFCPGTGCASFVCVVSGGSPDILLTLLILQTFRHLTYVTTHSPTLPSLIYVTVHSPTLPLLHLRHSSFSNPYFASPTSQAHMGGPPICSCFEFWSLVWFLLQSSTHGNLGCKIRGVVSPTQGENKYRKKKINDIATAFESSYLNVFVALKSL